MTEDGRYNTVDEARAAVIGAVEDTEADEEDSVWFDLVTAIACLSTRDVALELCRRELGWLPDDVRREFNVEEEVEFL